jgi:hypothetical protein
LKKRKLGGCRKAEVERKGGRVRDHREGGGLPRATESAAELLYASCLLAGEMTKVTESDEEPKALESTSKAVQTALEKSSLSLTEHF